MLFRVEMMHEGAQDHPQIPCFRRQPRSPAKYGVGSLFYALALALLTMKIPSLANASQNLLLEYD